MTNLNDESNAKLLKAQCPFCKATYNIMAARIGKQVKCPKCGKPFIVSVVIDPVDKILYEADESATLSTVTKKSVLHPPIKQSDGLSGFLNFQKMITPGIIEVSYMIISLLCIMGCIVTLIFGMIRGKKSGEDWLMIILSPIVCLAFLVWFRICCEILILFFKMYERLNSIDDTLKETNDLRASILKNK